MKPPLHRRRLTTAEVQNIVWKPMNNRHIHRLRVPLTSLREDDPEDTRTRVLAGAALFILLVILLALGFGACISPRALHGPAVDLYVQAQTVHDACTEQRVLDEDTKCSERAHQKLAEAARALVCIVEGESCAPKGTE